jgi:hypothetical protein
VPDQRAGNCDGVIVLGMHRSGTSAVNSMFAASGYFVGREADLMPAHESNPNGHWENTRLMDRHEEMLKRLGGTWLDPPPAETQRAAADWAVPMLEEELSRLVAEAGNSPVAIKDPRVSGLLPLWREVIPGRLHPVLVIRDPVEVARSLHRRDGTPPALGAAAWELHTTALLDFLDGREVTVAPYARLVSEPELAPRVVTDATQRVSCERGTVVAPERAGRTLEIQYHRNRAREDEHGQWLTVRQLELWRWLDALAPGHQVLEIPAQLRVASGAAREGTRQEAQRVAAARDLQAARENLDFERLQAESVTVEMAATRAELARAQATHRSVMSSASWRLTAPLRAAKGLVRRDDRVR